MAFAEASVHVQIVTHHAPPLGACHVAALVEVAVGTYHTAGVPVTVIPPILVESHAVRPEAVPVALVATRADGVPRAGVTSVGELAKTKAPVPVSSVTALARLAELGVERKVPTPAPGVIPAHVVKSASYACTVEPIASVNKTSPSVTAVFNCAFVVVTVLEPRDMLLFESVSVLEIVGTLTPPAWSLPVHLGTMFTFISVLEPVAVSVIVPVPPATW